MDFVEEVSKLTLEHWQKPLIVAIKGLPCTGKSILGRVLIDCLRYTLLVHDDIIASLHQSLPDLNPPQLDDLSFVIISQITSIQVHFRNRVVIDSPLSLRSQLDKLLEISSTTGAGLIVLECKPQDEYEWQNWFDSRFEVQGINVRDTIAPHKLSTWEAVENYLKEYCPYDDSDVPKVIVDPKFYELEELLFLTQRLPFCKTARCVELTQWVAEVSRRKLSRFLLRKPFGPEEEGKHVHVFNLLPSELTGYCCRSCEEVTSGEVYRCQNCELILHKHCAELPDKLENLHHHLPLYINKNQPEFSFPEAYACSLCQGGDIGFSSDCYECLFLTHIKSRLLPTILHHKGHVHPLHLTILPHPYRFQFRCHACGGTRESLSYRCTECNINFDVRCVTLPLTASHKLERHPMKLTFQIPDEEDESDEWYCDACEEKRNPYHWMYYCTTCKWSAHTNCVSF